MSKKILIITYYWPPAGGPGVQRWLSFTKHLPSSGFIPVVVAPLNATYPITDTTLLDQVSPALEIIKIPIQEPGQLAAFLFPSRSKTLSKGLITQKKQSLIEKTLLWIRGNIFIPDARKFWKKPVLSRLDEYIKKEGVDLVITTGPPHSVHLIGLALKNKYGLQWIADFRDPWTEIRYHSQLKLNKRAKKKHRVLEKKVLDSADGIVVTSYTTQNEFKEKCDTPMALITNGYEKEHFDELASPHKKQFVITHVGSLHDKRNPAALWQAIIELIREDKEFAKNMRLHLVGMISDEITNDLTELGLADYLDLKGYVAHKQARKYLKKSGLLLLIESDSAETRAIIPGKVFEYLAAQRPILAVGPENWDVARLFNETQIKGCFSYKEKEAIKNYIRQVYRNHQNGKQVARNKKIKTYSRQAITQKLAAFIRETTQWE